MRPEHATRAAGLVALLLICTAAPALAQTDPAAGRAQLKQGYELKQAGHYDEAFPHLLEAVRLDPQPKALMNLADCEEHLGKLSDADGHWVRARDRAAEQRDDALHAEAARRLAALEKRLPRLTIRLAAGAPADTVVVRDGVKLGAASLGVPLPGDPGAHVVEVQAKGHASKHYDVTLAEGQQSDLEVEPGEPVAETTPPPGGETTPPGETGAGKGTHAPLTPKTPPPPKAHGSALGTVGIVTLSVGAAALAAGGVFGILATVKNGDASCDPDHFCPDASSAASLSDALNFAHVANGLFIAGGVVAAAGLTLWLVAPSSSSSASAKVGFTPTGAFVKGVW